MVIEIDVDRKGDRFTLSINGDRLLMTDKVGELIDRLEREILETYGIKSKSKMAGLFGR